MGKAKTRKAILKRFKFTKSGKVLRRRTGVNHFLAKKSSKKKRLKKRLVKVHKSEAKIIKKLLKYSKDC